MSAPKIELKNLKYAEFASEETACFEATVYVNGKRFCIVSNDGRGGDNRYDALRGEKGCDLLADISATGKLVGKIVMDTRTEAEAYNKAHGLTFDALTWEEWKAARDEGRMATTGYEAFDDAVLAALDAALRAKDLKKLLAKRVVFSRGGKIYQTSAAPNKATLQHWLTAPNAAESLNADAILNNMPFEQALELYAKTAG